jgi:type II secretion system protein H
VNLSPTRSIPNPAFSPAGRAGTAAAAKRPGAGRGFTLIELILVLALLAIMTSLAAPSLSSFFRGRALDAEARQLLSLTHAGRSRAVATGFPELLWLDAAGHSYGLVAETASASHAGTSDSGAEEFTYNDQLRIDAVDATPLPVNGRSLPAIRFLPDGTIDDNSASKFRLTASDGDTLWLIQSTNHWDYEIRAQDK